MKLKGFNLTLASNLSPRDRYYQSYAWRKLRAEHLRLEPICRICDENGLTVIANTVDHIQQRRNGGTDTHDNLRSLCNPCHQKVSGIQGKDQLYTNHPKWDKTL